jgi:hypothetical protein
LRAKAWAAAFAAAACALALPAHADPLVPAPYGPGFTGGVVVGPRDGCRTVVHCTPGDFSNRPAHRRYYDNYFDVPVPRYSGQRPLRGNPALSGTAALGSAHLRWCSDRYRSYRASDDTYQPLSGPRRRCISPE